MGARMQIDAITSITATVCCHTCAGRFAESLTTLGGIAVAAGVFAKGGVTDDSVTRAAGQFRDHKRVTIQGEPGKLVVALPVATLVVAGQMTWAADLFLDVGSLLENGGQAGRAIRAAFTVAAAVD
jgi:hypothetical protein